MDNRGDNLFSHSNLIQSLATAVGIFEPGQSCMKSSAIPVV